MKDQRKNNKDKGDVIQFGIPKAYKTIRIYIQEAEHGRRGSHTTNTITIRTTQKN